MIEFEIVKSEYNALGEDNNYKTHYLKTSADQVVGLGRMKSFSYAVGDVVYTDNNMQVALKCTTAGTTSNTELDVSGSSVGDTITDGTVVWQVASRLSDGLPIGFILPFGANEQPAGWLSCDGTAVSRTVYADLFAVIGTNFGAGDGSTTFNLPNLNNNSFIEGDDVVGIVKEAGVPNIKGQDTLGWMGVNAGLVANGDLRSGALMGSKYETSLATTYTSFSGEVNVPVQLGVGFDASLYNPIYGNSDTVQPKSVTVKFCIKAYGAIANAGSVELEEMAKDYERIASSYLPLSGGNITGSITAKGDSIPTIGRYETDKQITLYAGSNYETGAVIALKGLYNSEITGEEGGFFISSTNGTTKHWLSGMKDGELLWKGSRVINGVSIQAQQVTTSNTPMYLPDGGTWVGIWVESVGGNDYASNGIIYSSGGSVFHQTASNVTQCSAIYFRVL